MAKGRKKPLLGVTLGDPCGIGPEVVLRALADPHAGTAARFVVFGSGDILRHVAEKFRLRPPAIVEVEATENIEGRPGPFLIDSVRCRLDFALRGEPIAEAGRAAIEWIGAAVRKAFTHEIDGVVTAPINKEAIHKAGYDWPGHTEMIASITGADRPVMMMVGGGLRVALVTTHKAIAELPGAITTKNVLETIRVLNHDLRRYFGPAKPRIAVCALNPHAGEAGRFGREEIVTIAPAVRRARAEGIDCDGPTSADVVFTRQQLASHDAVVAMYHDQATIPVKMLAFNRGVNVTLGLPIIRTSPDHGTAYDIVRKGTADPGSMIEATLLAARMADKWRRTQ